MKKIIPILLLAGSAILSGCGDSNDYNQVSGQQGNPGTPSGPSAPVAVNDVYATDEDDAITLTAAQGVLANDQVNDQAEYVTVDFPAATAQGGTITQTADTGAFTYTPALGFTGTDSFTYTLTNREGSDTATVTIEVDAAVVAQGYFVDSTNGNDTTADFNTGAPYASIQAAVLAAPVNSDIVVRPGNYTGAVTLKNGQRLLGSGSELVNAQGVQRPVLAGAVNLADGNTLDFLRISGTQGDAVVGSSRNGGTITNCEIDTPVGLGASAITVAPGTGSWLISDNVISGTPWLSIDLATEGTGQMRARVNNNSVTGSSSSAISLLAEDSSELTVQVQANTLTGNQDNFTFEAVAGDSAVLSLDIEDNINDDVYRFSLIDAAVMNVEQLSQLESINQSGDVVVDSGPEFVPPTDVPNGFCGF